MALTRRVAAPLTLAVLSLAIAACQNTFNIVSTGKPAVPGAPEAEPGTATPSDPASGPTEGPITVPVIIVDVSEQREPAPEESGDGGASGGEAGAPGGDSGSSAPAPVETSAPLPPLAIVAVEANHSHPGYAPERAVDGNRDTEWGTGEVTGGMLTLTFNQEAAIASLGLKTGPTPQGAQIHIETSTDGADWQLARTVTNASWEVETHPVPGAPIARYVRLRYEEGSSGQPAFSVFEVNVQASLAGQAGPVSPTPTLAPVAGTTIYVETASVLHPAESRLLGTNRNHAANDFNNGAAKLQKMRELQPQWGDRKYLYRIGHGPTDGRHDYHYMTGFHFEQSWNKTSYPYDDIREGLKDAAAFGADQMHVVNYGTSDPAEAGRYVSYLNKRDDANRAKYPIAQQNVRWFELGNEIPWTMVRGHNEHAPNERVYAERAKRFAEEMRKNSDIPIKIGAVASINSNWEGNGWSGGSKTVQNILSIMGDQVDFLIYHGYPSWPLHKKDDLLTLMAQNEWNHQKLTNEIEPAIRAHGGGRDIRIANTEFFTHLYNDVTRSRGLFGALYSADTLTLAFNHNMMSAVQFAFEHKDMADASFFFNNDVNNTTAIFKFQKLLAEHWGDNIVKTRGQEIPTVNVAGSSASVTLPKLAYTAATSGSKTYVMVTHRLNDSDVKSNVHVGFTPSKVTAYELSDGSGWNAANASVKTIANPSLNGYTFKKASVTIFEIER